MTSVQTLTVSDDEADTRLDRWFKRRFPELGHGALQKLLRTGQVRVDGKRAKAEQRLEAGQQVRVPPLPAREEGTPRPKAPRQVTDKEAEALRHAILYMDEWVIALNKPPGLAVQGGTNMEKHLDAMLDALRFDGERPRLVHRLDKDTSGVLLLGRTAGAAAKLAAEFRSRAARKCYWALVAGVPKLRQGRIDAPLAKLPGRLGEKVAVDEDEGKRAVTWYRVVDSVLRRAAWLEMEPRTGRTHQLRAHCVLLGTPIIGDGKYGGTEAFVTGTGVSRKMHLHARALRMPHPKGKGMLEVVAPIPEHFRTSFSFFGFDEAQAGRPFEAFEEE
ncbi:RluA family pseudouridine synthase [Telmatospirillum sp. J64-1]|uniref:RluA family pseudouridine synthase n=1 Tax=Telmatospirillum sp. J64-1 TaxID=2502183 RepID=UPI00115D4B5E|nr:RluA family pseudouridine synthase [Telmatospirillum sp. J64-1]